MTRFKRAVLGFMLIANLGVYSAFALWVLIDGGLPRLPKIDVAAAAPIVIDTEAPPAESSPTPPPPVMPVASPTPGWTPPPISLAPLPMLGATTEAGLLVEASPVPSEIVPTDPARPTDVPEVAPTQAAEPTFDLPASARVTGLVGHRQALPLSCEARSATDWAAFFGVKMDEMEFVRGLPVSDDPDRGFVGDINGEWGNLPPEAYGVHAAPVARLLRQYGVPAASQRYMAWDALRAEIAAGRPVMVWVTGHVEAGEGLVYTAGDGRRTIVARFEHTVIVVGYDDDSVIVADGANTYRRPLERFLESWGALRNMAITGQA